MKAILTLLVCFFAWSPVEARQTLTADTTLFVSVSGNDAGDCSSNNPCVTLNGAWKYAQSNLDLGCHNLTIQNAAGSYPVPSSLSGLMVGQCSPVVVQGDLAAPTNVVLTNGSSGQITLQVQSFAWITIQGVELESVGAQVLRVLDNAIVGYKTIVFGPSGGTHVAALMGGRVNILGDYSIIANGNVHFNCNLDGSIAVEANTVITLVGQPYFSQEFAICQGGKFFGDYQLSFSGTGSAAQNFAVILNGVMNTGSGGNINYFPFGSLHTIDSGSRYN